MSLKKESSLILIASMPALYLALIWNELPSKIPTHFNFKGEIDHWGDRIELLPFIVVPIFLFLILLIVSKTDALRNNNAFQVIKLIIMLVVSLTITLMMYTIKNQSMGTPRLTSVGVGIITFLSGYFMRNIKPNFLIGIRTPWTLEDETNWRETHLVAGRFWLVGGIVILVICFFFKFDVALTVVFIIMGILVLVPILYSYRLFINKKGRE
ncbi:MAG TPA: SdpI family protein [Cyclobacteriaceae bacterium]|nr:SdpI family protein [Cyclobacteriaceae bacterium]